MPTRRELLEGEVRTVNKQLYESYKHIAELVDRIAELEKIIENQQEVINGLAAG